MKVLLLAGGSSNEREVSIRSGNSVETALASSGYDVLRADPAEPGFNLEELAKVCDVVFLALHGAGGEDGVLQARLEALNIPFVGCSSAASALCWDKWRYKQLMIKNNIQIPKGALVTKNDLPHDLFKQPFVLKPIKGGSTIDVIIARTVTRSIMDECASLLQKYDQMLLEKLIEGVEITVAVLCEKPLPVVEIIPPPNQEFNYENKYNDATQELVPPPHVEPVKQTEAQALGLKIHNLTGCRDISRTDMIVDKSGQLHVLETNTIPGMPPQSLLPKAAKAAGISMADLVDRLIKNAKSR